MWKAIFFCCFVVLGTPKSVPAQIPPMTSFQELPVYPGARPLEEEGIYEIEASFGTVYTRYQEQLELEGYTVSELSRDEESAFWEITRGDQTFFLFLDASENGTILLQIIPPE